MALSSHQAQCGAFSTRMPRHISAFKGTRTSGKVSRRTSVQVVNEKVLIVNTKSGGHAFVGLYLAKQLLAKGHQVTILNDGDKAKLTAKAPFSQYDNVRGLNVVWGNPADPSTFPRDNFDVVYDNNGKDLKSCQPVIDAFGDQAHKYVFVGSAGAYKANSVEPMHVEGDPRKSSAGHVEVEDFLRRQWRLNHTVVQPLYIYGPHNAKDMQEWFIDRIIRDRPVLIPEPGVQLTSLTHVEDVASLLAAILENPSGSANQHYNVCSDRCITFLGIAKAVGKALGKEPKVVLYNPEKLGVGKGAKAEGFPFRTSHFFASCDKAKRELGWAPAHDFLSDVADLVADYQRQGRQNKNIDFSVDDKILVLLGQGTPASNGAAPTSSSVVKSAAGGALTSAHLEGLKVDDLMQLARQKGVSVGRSPTRASVVAALAQKQVGVTDLSKSMLSALADKMGIKATTPEEARNKIAQVLGSSTPASSGYSSSYQAASPTTMPSGVATSLLTEADLAVFKIDDLTTLARKRGVQLARNATRKDLLQGILASKASLADLTKGMLTDLAVKLGQPVTSDVDQLRQMVAKAKGGSVSAVSRPTNGRSGSYSPAPAAVSSASAGSLPQADLEGFKIDDLMQLCRTKGVVVPRNATRTDVVRGLVQKGVSADDLSRGMLVDLCTRKGQPTSGDLKSLRERVGASSRGQAVPVGAR